MADRAGGRRGSHGGQDLGAVGGGHRVEGVARRFEGGRVSFGAGEEPAKLSRLTPVQVAVSLNLDRAKRAGFCQEMTARSASAATVSDLTMCCTFATRVDRHRQRDRCARR